MPTTPAVLALVFAVCCAPAGWGQVPVPGQGSTRPRPEETPQRRKAGAEGAVPVFEFHSGFWINLHHFLYQQARLLRPEEPAGALNRERRGGNTAEKASTAGFPPEEERDWKAALDYYAGHLAGQDLLFIGDMVAIKNRLAELEACPDLSGRSAPACAAGLRPELIAALERAAPVYRQHWWPEHDRSNRAWIAGVAPLLRELGGALAEKLAEVYQAEWPGGRIRVDVSFNANWAGAYTTREPVHVTLASGAEGNQGPAALEILFHEASHALAGAVRDAIARECRARNKPIPRDLWHALLFYTTGEIVKRSLGSRSGDQPYTPYAYRHGLYARGWQNYQRLLERHWQPFLDGKTDFDSALTRLVAAL